MKSKFQVFITVAIIFIGACSSEFDLLANPVELINRAPTFQELSDTNITAGDTLRLQVKAQDPENDPIIYEFFVAPIPGTGLALAHLDTLTDDFWFAAQRSDVPFRWFGFFAYDDKRNKGSTDIVVTVVIP